MSTSLTDSLAVPGGGAARLEAELNEAIRSGRLRYGERLRPIRDLASQYGVSPTTVRKILGRLEIRGLVRRAERSGTYVTHRVVRERRTGTVYLLINRDEHVYGRIADSVVEQLQDTPWTIVLAARRLDRGFEQFARLLDVFRRRPPEAIVLHWYDPRLDQAIAEICGDRTRVILAKRGDEIAPDNWLSVREDAVGMFRTIVEHLTAMGHRRFGLLVPRRTVQPDDPATLRKRRFGSTREILALGQALREVGIRRHGMTIYDKGEAAVGLSDRQVLEDPVLIDRLAQWLSQPNRPTAIIGMDFATVQVIYAARKLGWRIPEDLAIVGFGNTPWAEAFNLTSMSFREELLAKRIVELITADPGRLQGSVHRVLVQPRLVARASCGG